MLPMSIISISLKILKVMSIVSAEQDVQRKTGIAFTFVTPREISHLRLIEQVARKKIERKSLPTLHEALEGQQRITMEKF